MEQFVILEISFINSLILYGKVVVLSLEHQQQTEVKKQCTQT